MELSAEPHSEDQKVYQKVYYTGRREGMATSVPQQPKQPNHTLSQRGEGRVQNVDTSGSAQSTISAVTEEDDDYGAAEAGARGGNLTEVKMLDSALLT